MAFLDEIKLKLLKNQDVELILINGSFALDNMSKFSDIDLEVITKNNPTQEFNFEIILFEGQKKLVTIFYSKLDNILSSLDNSEEWSILQNYQRAKVLYDKNNNIELIKNKIKSSKPSKKDLFNRLDIRFIALFEYLAKTKNAYIKNDDLNLIYSAKQVAFFAYLCLKSFNKVEEIKSEKEIIYSQLNLENKPLNYEKYFKICAGLDFNNFSKELLFQSTHELVREIYDFMKINKVWFKDKKLKRIFEDDYFVNLMSYENI